MDLLDLRYFVAVAETQNLHVAARRVHVSAAALSKAVRRLEADLQTVLFERRNRGLHLNAAGAHLQRRAGRLLQDAEQLKSEIAGPARHVHLRLAGPEILLAHFAPPLVARLGARYPDCDARILAIDELSAIGMLSRGECDIALVSDEGQRRAKAEGLAVRKVGGARFRVGIGANHPLAKGLGDRPLRLSVESLLEHAFAVPTIGLFAGATFTAASDGWRDDVFPRRTSWRTDNLQVLGGLLRSGLAVAYLPEYICEDWNLRTLQITGCPFTCKTSVFTAYAPYEGPGWLKHLVGAQAAGGRALPQHH